MLDASILPAMKRPGTLQNARQIQGLLDLSEVVVWALLLGILVLFAAIGAFGFVYSKKVGIWTVSAAAGILGVFVLCCFKLDHVMRM